jgi:uncharacterized membrane protein YozB (DUF420 family)
VANNNKHPNPTGAESSRGRVAKVAPEPTSRAQRILMYMGGSILGLGIVSIVVLLIGELTVSPKVFESSSLWETIAVLPLPAITIGFALLLALIIVTFVKRSQAAKVADK